MNCVLSVLLLYNHFAYLEVDAKSKNCWCRSCMVNPFEFEVIKIEVLNCAVKTATVCRSFRVEIP